MNYLRKVSSLVAIVLWGGVLPVAADVKMAGIFGDHMVLQQGINLPVWGTAAAGEKVTVTVGTESASATAGPDGKWMVKLAPLPAGTAAVTMTVKGKNSLIFNDVAVGDVWICSGQYNMRLGIRNASDAATEIPKANHPLIRLFRVPEKISLTAEDDVAGVAPASPCGKWMVCTPKSVGLDDGPSGGFSAIGYFFGQEIQKTTGQPVGLIESTTGDCTTQAWTSLSGLEKAPELKHYADDANQLIANHARAVAEYPAKQAAWAAARAKWNQDFGTAYNASVKDWDAAVKQAKAAGQAPPPKPQPPTPAPNPPANPDGGMYTPTALFNGMLASLIPYGIKGAIWYQAETNGGRPEEYAILFPRMISDWREKWGEGDFPFLFVQLTFNRSPAHDFALLRESQVKTLSLPNTGMAVTYDIGDPNDEHSKDKHDVGLRLALAARHVAYGQKIVYSGPIYDSIKVEGRIVRVNFTQTGSGLTIGTAPWTPPGGKGLPASSLVGFIVAGEDKNWVPADAKIDGNTVVVSSPAVARPVAIRYAFDDAVGNLYNKEGLPASPFRSDGSDIRTPAASFAPRINGPRVYGARPGHPFFYHLPVTGQRPLTISAEGLPKGLNLDPVSGNITGAVTEAGDYAVTFTANNAAGRGNASLRIVIGPTICLTPPMGWNSWNAYGTQIDEGKIRGAADAMAGTGLIDHGWTYVNMDDHWQGQRDASGNIQAGPDFPDVKALADYIHGKGLKAGLYSSPGIQTCAGATASWQHEDQDAATYAAWGMDYLKYDWCSYGIIADILRSDKYAGLLPADKSNELRSLALEKSVLLLRSRNRGLSAFPQSEALKVIEAKIAGLSTNQMIARLKEIDSRLGILQDEVKKANPGKAALWENEIPQQPYLKMRMSLDKVNRDIVYSLSPGLRNIPEWGARVGANTWRTGDDIRAVWGSIESNGFSQNGLEAHAGPGHWNDPDMLEIGNGQLTSDEVYTHMTLWCMLSAPLLIGCDMHKMDFFTISLFSNDEVLAVDQDELGKQGWRATQNGRTEVWEKPLADKSLAVAFFNRGDAPADVSVQWSDLKLTGPQELRDLWRQKDIGDQESGYSVNVAAHGAELYKISPKKSP